MSTTKNFTVEGMHCQGCVNAVTAEVSGVDGVENVDVGGQGCARVARFVF